MNIKIFIGAIFVMANLANVSTAAPGDVALGLKAGTLGLGLELTVEAADQVNVRFGGNYFKINTEVDVEDNDYDLEDNTYTSAEVGVLNADAGFKSVAPYLGIGWGNPLRDDSDWSFMVDLGVIFAGKPSLDITSTGGTLSNDPTLLADIAQTELEFNDSDELKYLKYYPVLSVGLNYRF
ncbi:MAG: hypothetical protein HOH19_01065 [Kordiimonadaceae bacterium]|nr:hypothetical protein [Kordiimonadaceae bacterium]MBT6031139.1 hypothetical protein [Kordiimonadaceae bacterium]